MSVFNSLFLENDTPEEIEDEGDFHEPEWKPTGDDGEFTIHGEKIPGTVNKVHEFSSIFYDMDVE